MEADSLLGIGEEKKSNCFDFPVAARTNYKQYLGKLSPKIIKIITTATKIENCVPGIYPCYFV